MNCEPLCQFGERLFFTTFPHPPPAQATVNKLAAVPGNEPPLRAGCSPHNDATYHYFTVDDRLLYFSFFKDWGPLNIAMVYKACILIHELLEEVAPQRLVLYSSSDPTKKANTALLIALYSMIVQRRAPWEAFQPIGELEFLPFRDAGRGPSDFNLNIQDCLWGVWKAMQNGLCDLNEFDVDDYEYYEKVEHGDWNWISPHFIAFASPVDPYWIKKQKEAKESSSSDATATSPTPATAKPSSSANNVALQRKLPVPFLNCLDYFEKRNIKLVVRLNTELYDRNTFLERGIDHMELYFDDGTNPTDEIVRTFLDVTDRVIESGGVVAVHCKAGLGRTGTLIGAYLIWKYGFTASEAIAFMRIVRPGSVVGPQQQYIYLKQLEWSKWAAVDELRKQHEASAIVKTPAIVTPATPPADTDDELPSRTHSTPTPAGPRQPLIPPVTPSRHVAAATAKARAIATPGQPRKTPKRAAQDSDDDEDLEDDVLPALGVAPVRSKLRHGKTTGAKAATEQRPSRVTRSTTATRKPPPSPTKFSGQGPNKIPRLATTKTTSAAKAVVAAQQQSQTSSRRPLPTPTPSRLPTLAKRGTHTSTLSEVAAAVTLNKGVPTSDWMTTNASAVVAPGNKTEHAGLRKVRRRRSSFSSADVVV